MHILPSRTALAAALAIALAGPAAAASRIAASSPTPDAIEAARPNTSLLILRAGIFDPVAQSLDFSASNAAPGSASSYAIVQFQQGRSVDRVVGSGKRRERSRPQGARGLPMGTGVHRLERRRDADHIAWVRRKCRVATAIQHNGNHGPHAGHPIGASLGPGHEGQAAQCSLALAQPQIL